MQLLLVSWLNVFKQLSGVYLQALVIPVLHLYLLFEIQGQFHYFLLTWTADLLYADTLFVMCRAHVVQFLLQFSVFQLILLFLYRWFLFNIYWIFVRKTHGEALSIKLWTGLCGSLIFKFERTIKLGLSFSHIYDG